MSALTRRSRVIHLLQRLVQLQRDQMADEQSRLIDKRDRATLALDALRREQGEMQAYSRLFSSPGVEMNVDIYRTIAFSGADRLERISSAVDEARIAECDVENMRENLYRHEEKIRKLDEISDRERNSHSQREATIESNANDSLWLLRREG